MVFLLLKNAAKYAEAQYGNDDACRQDADHNDRECLFGVHVQHGTDEGTHPCAGTGQGDGYKKEHAPIGIFSDLVTFGICFSFAPFHEPPEGSLLQYPEDEPDEQQDEGDGQKIADICDDKCGQPFHTHGEAGDDAASQLQNGHQGYDEYDEFPGKGAGQVFYKPGC